MFLGPTSSKVSRKVSRKVLSQKEQALDRSYQPNVEMKEGKNLVITFQTVVYEAFKQAFPRVQEKPGYSIKTPKSGNKQTQDGSVDSHALQVNIDDRKAYTINFYNTTSRINVNGHKLQTAFIDKDYPFVLGLISDLTPRQIFESIGKAKELPPPERKALEGSTHSQTSSKTATESTGTAPIHTAASPMPNVSASPDHIDNGPNPPASHIPAPQHSSPPVVGPPPLMAVHIPQPTSSPTPVSQVLSIRAQTTAQQQMFGPRPGIASNRSILRPPGPVLTGLRIPVCVHPTVSPLVPNGGVTYAVTAPLSSTGTVPPAIQQTNQSSPNLSPNSTQVSSEAL